jgi:hypothetical protein
MSDRPPAYAITVRKKRGSEPYISNPEFRLRAIALATTGISRRGAALRLGIALATLAEYLERGRAMPDEEPWGSFAAEYLAAERGLEEAANTTIGLWVQHLRALAETKPEKIRTYDIETLLKVMASRFPVDHGVSPHRSAEPDPSGEQWLERNALTQDQLQEMLRRPPEPIREAMTAAADDVYQLLLESGWKPKQEAT